MKILKSLIFLNAFVFLILLGGVTGVQAQLIRDTTLIKPVPVVTGWFDDDHYTFRKWNRAKGGYENFKVNIHSLETRAVEEKRTPVLKVKIKNGNAFLETNGVEKQLTYGDLEVKLPLLSPDKKKLAFLRGNDLYTLDIESGEEFRYTRDGSDVFLNGYASWVYYEEILKRDSEYRAFWWSPDSQKILFYRFDDSEVPIHPLFSTEGQHGQLNLTRYPKAGDPNPKVKVGLVHIGTEEVSWADFDTEVDQYFGRPYWTPDSKEVLVQWMPRRQNELVLFSLDVHNGSRRVVYQEKQDTWIDWILNIRWINDGFLVVRDFEGWEHIYYQNIDGRKPLRLTEGKLWNTKILYAKSENEPIIYTSQAEESTRQDIYSVDFKGSQKKLSKGPYTNKSIFVSPNAEYLLTHYSNASSPTVLALINAKTGEQQTLHDSKGEQFETARFKKREVLWMKTSDGFDLPAMITYPANMQQGEKYPLYIHVYGGPKYQIVNDGWVNPSVNREDEAYIRVNFDHRGAGHQGKEGLNYLYGNLGKWEMHDYIEWIKLLKGLPEVDSSRVLISGGSYGGYLTALAVTYGAEYFKLGIADFPVTDWRLYDSHYTERYMGLPDENPDGYEFGSILTHVEKYRASGKGMLYLQHGTMDDNVHIQNTYQLVDLLQRQNKEFELMVYPGERHGWLGPKSNFVGTQRNRFLEKYFFKK